jgi:peptide/nickel transport system substrate-binding protein
MLCLAGMALALAPGAASAGRSHSDASVPSTLTVALSLTPFTLNPIEAGHVSDIDIVHLFGGNLFELRGAENGSIVPGLAVSYQTTSNGLGAVIKLRPHLRFSDGSPLTARDVVTTLLWSKNDPNNGYPSFYAPIKTATAPNPSTINVTFTQRFPDFKYLLSYTNFAILPAKYLTPKPVADDSSFFRQPISAGPYKVASPWNGSGGVTLVRNPYYWGPKPIIPKISFITITDNTARVNQLKSGQIDMTDSIPPTIVRELANQGLHAYAATSYGDILIDIDNAAPPLDNVNVRRAISLALNRDQIAKIAFAGVVPPLAGFWPQHMIGYDPSIPTAPNVAEAKALLKGTPCESGCTLEFDYSPSVSAFGPAMVPIVQANLAAIGIQINAVQMDGAALGTKVFAQANYQLALTQTYDNGNIPDGVLSYMLLSNGRGPVVGAEASRYKSPQMDALITKAVESTGKTQATALKQINQLFLKDQPWLPITPFLNGVASRVPTNVAWFDHSLFVEVARAK